MYLTEFHYYILECIYLTSKTHTLESITEYVKLKTGKRSSGEHIKLRCLPPLIEEKYIEQYDSYYHITIKGQLFWREISVEGYEEYNKKQKDIEDKKNQKEDLEFKKLYREVYFLKDPRFWVGFGSGATTTIIALLAIYLAWVHK